MEVFLSTLIKCLIENKEWALLIFLTISVTVIVTVKIYSNKKIVIIKNNNTNNYYGSTKRDDSNNKETVGKPHKKVKSKTPHKKNSHDVELFKIRLYATGKKGKTYTTNYNKNVNHNFGVELILKNNTSCIQKVQIEGAIHNKNKRFITGWSSAKKIKANSILSFDFYVKKEDFSIMKQGEYSVQFCIDDEHVQKQYFTIQ